MIQTIIKRAAAIVIVVVMGALTLMDAVIILANTVGERYR